VSDGDLASSVTPPSSQLGVPDETDISPPVDM
jgi:hypothetical protein